MYQSFRVACCGSLPWRHLSLSISAGLIASVLDPVRILVSAGPADACRDFTIASVMTPPELAGLSLTALVIPRRNRLAARRRGALPAAKLWIRALPVSEDAAVVCR